MSSERVVRDASVDQDDVFVAMADFFTLLSFTFILMVLVYGLAEIHLQEETVPGASPIQRVTPKGEAEIVLAQREVAFIVESHDSLTTVSVATSNWGDSIVYRSDTGKSLNTVLTSLKPIVSQATYTQLIARYQPNRIDADVFVEVQQWLAAERSRLSIRFEEFSDDKF